MLIYEEIQEAREEAGRESRNKTYTLAEREYYTGKKIAFCEVLEMFDKRKSPEEHRSYTITPFFVAKEVYDFLPPKMKDGKIL